MIVSTAAAVLERRIRTTRATRESAPDIPYQLDDFLDDCHSLAAHATHDVRPPTRAHIVEVLDGRLLVIHLDPLLAAARADRHMTKTFFWKYGRKAAASRLSRLRMVLDFLDRSRAELFKAGVADDGEPMAVREELVRYLLTWTVDPMRRKPPKSALTRFLDDWGHRWM